MSFPARWPTSLDTGHLELHLATNQVLEPLEVGHIDLVDLCGQPQRLHVGAAFVRLGGSLMNS